MIQSKAIKEKIRSVGSIKKITKTMEMVSVSKMRKAISSTQDSREYSRYALELLITLSKKKQLGHPLLMSGKGEKTLLVIVASNKGLCGGYNTNINRSVKKYCEELAEINTKIDCVTIGKQSERIARRNKLNIIGSFHTFGENIELDEVRSLRKFIQNKFMQSGLYKNVVIVYTQFIKQLDYRPIVTELIPISPKTTRNIIEEIEEGRSEERFKKDSLALYLFEPNEEEVLEQILPTLLTGTIFQILLEAGAAEHSSRMVAMKNATENAKEIESDLTLTFNRARQASITQEISEIISGANALN